MNERETVRTLVLNRLQEAEDEIRRVNCQAERMTSSEMHQPYGDSGKTFFEHVEGCHAVAAELERALSWVERVAEVSS